MGLGFSFPTETDLPETGDAFPAGAAVIFPPPPPRSLIRRTDVVDILVEWIELLFSVLVIGELLAKNGGR